MDNETEVAEATPAPEPMGEEQVANTLDSTPEQQPEAEQTETPKKKHWAHDRIDQLTRQRRDAERERDELRSKLEQKQAPSQEQFDDYDDYVVEKASYKMERDRLNSQSESLQRSIDETFQLRVDAAREIYTDYDVVAQNPALPITDAMAEVIKDSDQGPDIAYYLGKNPKEALRIATLSKTRQAVEIGKLEDRLSKPAPIKKPPPAPINPVTGSSIGTVAKDPSKMSDKEWFAARYAKG